MTKIHDTVFTALDHKIYVAVTYKYHDAKCYAELTIHTEIDENWLKCLPRYYEKSLDHEIWATVTYRYYEVICHFERSNHTNNNENLSNGVPCIKQSHLDYEI